jgi:AcrR family transcriptional regulator
MERGSTKEKILHVAVWLFSDMGYERVTMRDIARNVGIKVASIYNHYPSKRDLLKCIYAFYAHQQRLAAPSLEHLLRLAETEPVQSVLMKLDYRFPVEHEATLNRILIIASHGVCTEEDSACFLQEHFFNFYKSQLVPLLNKLIELGRIEPIHVDGFVCLATYYAFSTAVLNQSRLKVSLEQWRSGLGMVFSLLQARD